MTQLTFDNLQPKKFIPSKYQEDIFDFIKHGKGHCIINAAAGAAKTSTLVKSLEYIPKNEKAVFCAFNKHIAETLKERIPTNCWATTLHCVGYRAIMMAGYKSRIDKFKQGAIFEHIVKRDKIKNSDDYFYPVRDLVSLMKGMYMSETENSIQELREFYDIDINGDIKTCNHLVLESLKIAALQKSVVDFDDMIWLPLKHELYIPQYKYIFADEVQDMNVSQAELALGMMHPDSRVFAVGDQNQSCYAFRGASIDSMEYITRRLKAKELPLSISYRCPISHVKLAQQYVPSIEAAPNAKEGVIKYITVNEFSDIIKEGDMCICRNNAPLTEYAFAALDKGFKINIRGQDIGHGLQTLVKSMKATDIKDFQNKINIWANREIELLKKENKNPERIEDKYQALMTLSKHVKHIKELIPYIKKLFSDENKEIVFSSIHRAKGLEAERVFILKFGLIPSRWAKLPFELEQEKNLQYIAITRSKSELYFVD